MILGIFDIETTGVDRTKDFIIQFAGIKINTETQEILEELNLYIQPIGDYNISIGALLKHHITKEFLADKPTMRQVAPQIIAFFNDINNILTYNGNSFDIPFLKTELNKYGFDINFMAKNCYDAFLIEKERNGISLENTYKRYKGKTMEEAGLTAHNAFSDIKGTYSVFVAQQRQQAYGPQKMYGEDNIITDMEYEGKLEPCFNIGKYKNVPLRIIKRDDIGYLNWCINKANFMESTKEYIKQYINE